MGEPNNFSSQLSPSQSTTVDAGFSYWTEPGTTISPCPYANKPPQTRQPCDVDLLMMTDFQTGVFVKATAKLADKPVKDAPPHLVDDLKQFDIVLERAVDYEGMRIAGTSRNAEKPKIKLDLQVGTRIVGSCLHADHPLIKMSPMGLTHAEPKADRQWKAVKSDRMQMEGWPSLDKAAANAGHSGVSLFAPLWVFGANPQSWRVSAESCAIRESGKPLGSLSGLVRIYSHDEYEFSFSFPAAVGFSASKSGSVNVKGSHKHDTSTSLSQFGQTVSSTEKSDATNRDGSRSSSSSSSTLENGVLNTEGGKAEWDANGKLQSATLSSNKQTTGDSKLILVRNTNSASGKLEGGQYTGSGKYSQGQYVNEDFDQESEFRPMISLKKNDRELDVTKFLNNLFNLEAKIKKAITDIKDLVPSVGWKVSLDLKVLEGSITGKWGVQNAEDVDSKSGKPIYAYQTDRYVAVRKYYGFEFAVTVFGATLTLMVGVEVKVNAVFWDVGELTIKLEGKLAGEVGLKWSVTNDIPVAAPRMEATLKGSVCGVCRANAAGYQLVDANAQLDGGLKFTGVPHVGLSESPRIEATLDLLATSVTYWGVVGKEPPDPVKVNIYEEKPGIWQGNLLGASEAKTA
jgi:hypothetical protein